MSSLGQSIFRVHVLGADHGDCILIEYGSGANIHCVVIDGGTVATFPRLLNALEQRGNAEMDLLVVTHVDNDHVGGVLPLIEHKISSRFKDIWFNGRPHLNSDELYEPFGAAKGERLTAALLKGAPWNEAFGKKAVRLDDNGTPRRRTLPGGAKVTVMSPGRTELSAMINRWDYEVRKAGMVPTHQIPDTPPPSGFQSMGPAIIDIKALADMQSTPDNSEPNGTSIALLIEFADRKALFAGDAFPDVLINAASKLPASELTAGTVQLDLFKLPHHGSQGNVSVKLLETFPSRRYVFSTNSKIHKHPDDVTVARVIEHARHPDHAPHLIFNYTTSKTSPWKPLSRSKRIAKNYKFSTEYGKDDEGIVIDLMQ